MNREGKKAFYAGVLLIAAFALFTMLVQRVDVQAVGVHGTDVGFAALNTCFHRMTGVHMRIYHVTDWLSLVPVGVCLYFAGLGFVQWLKRKSLLLVDADLLLLGVYYAVVIGCYMGFEMIPVHYRPVLIDGRMEASYPSSTTLLVLSVMPTLAF
ncbi:MAG: phosphoesterase PA-phosphatase, partial [Clostridia bacterium]|nr:phosphoesterase PA-phosphatase [Clostridia bacterium]